MNETNEQLQDDQASLLMYLSGELTAAQEGAVKKRLAVSESLAAQLEALRGIHESLCQTAAAESFVDENSARAAARMFGREVVRRAVQPAERKVAVSSRRGWPWWAYPSAAAAALILGTLAWWGNQPSTSNISTLPTPQPTQPMAETTPDVPWLSPDNDPSDQVASIQDKLDQVRTEGDDAGLPLP